MRYQCDLCYWFAFYVRSRRTIILASTGGIENPFRERGGTFNGRALAAGGASSRSNRKLIARLNTPRRGTSVEISVSTRFFGLDVRKRCGLVETAVRRGDGHKSSIRRKKNVNDYACYSCYLCLNRQRRVRNCCCPLLSTSGTWVFRFHSPTHGWGSCSKFVYTKRVL